jgi:serine/threonine protein kinase
MNALLACASDIKPGNFVRRCSETRSAKDLQFCLLDFGIAKKLPKSSSRGDETSGFRGTTMYASVAAHAQQRQGPAADLWSLLFVLVDLLAGHLPWTAAARSWQSSKSKHKREQPCSASIAGEEEKEEGGDNSEERRVKRRRVREGESGSSRRGLPEIELEGGGGSFKDEVFALKKTYTSKSREVSEKETETETEERETDQEKDARGGGRGGRGGGGGGEGEEDALLTRWVLQALSSSAETSRAQAPPQDRVAALRRCLNAFVGHLQVRRLLQSAAGN